MKELSKCIIFSTWLHHNIYGIIDDFLLIRLFASQLPLLYAREWTCWVYGDAVFNFSGRRAFRRGCAVTFPAAVCEGPGLLCPHPHQHFLFFAYLLGFLLVIADLVGVKCFIIVPLNCISLTTNYIERLFKYLLVICVSLDQCLLRSFSSILIGLFIFCVIEL